MDAKTQYGYLVIADISGFTSYLAKVELEHAHEILTDLLEKIVKEFKTLLMISKLEDEPDLQQGLVQLGVTDPVQAITAHMGKT